ncbi:MAG: hypothetical protein RLZZ337_446, partial [Bacteroidota bacterium]
MQLKQILFILFTFGISTLAIAQPRSFSKKPEVFITEFNAYINSNNSKEGAEILKIFTEKWNLGNFGENEQRTIIKVSNEMLINKLDIPDFVLLTETVLLGKDSVEQSKYENWMQAILPAVKSGNKTYLTLLNSSKNLFKDNILYASETKKWYSSKNNYIFDFQANRVKISFNNIDLICQADVDKLVVYNTSGSFYLDNDEWEGRKGKVTWERVGFGKDNIYAEIQGNYKMRFDRAQLDVDSVIFTNKDFLSRNLLGSFKDRASSADEIKENSLLQSAFPQFSSYEKDIELGSYLDNTVKFKGGYAMKGAEIIATGSAKNPSIVEIYYKKKPRVTAYSEYFSLSQNKIVARTSEVYIGTDSGEIHHPKIQFNLNLDNKVLLLTRGKDGLEQAPFFDDDHQVEIYVDQVIWKLDQPKIEFDMSGEDSRAMIESSDFYKEERYEKIPRGMLNYHPLSKMRDFVIKYRKREFTFTEYADWMGSKQTYLKPQIIELADLGYIFFNPATDSIKVRKKLDHAVLSHMKLADYDVIRLSSLISARSNAYLSLMNNNLVVEGVVAFRFSDSQSVYIFPEDQKVTLKSKRRMSFGGKLTAGKFDFYSSSYEFDYHTFEITSDQIDSMKIFMEDFTGKNQLVGVKSVLRDINGTLEIDKSNNKSGLTNYPEYPRFTSKKGSVIAYDKPSIHGGTYNKERFRFEVDPFTIDSLDNFTTSGLKFPGTFISGGIIPEFRYEASIMDDYSLGFERANPPGGYPMYGGIGHGDIDIKLSEEGFTAKGELEYQGAKITSRNILMTPDSTISEAESYIVKENAKYPNVVAMDVTTRWMPYKDSLHINTQGHTVKVLRDNQDFTGNLVQTSSQIAGDGLLAWDRAKLTSKDMKFKPNKVDARYSQIEIGSISSSKIAFASYNVESHVDFTTRIGEFKANEKGKLTDFPFNAYASSMDEYKWDMNAETIELNKGPALATTESYFVSKKPEQQGLSFISTKALFDMKAGIIYADKVPYIDVADSRIFPFEEKLTIFEDANMKTLEQAKMLASRDDKFHDIFDAKIKISGRYELGGSGNYIYKDKHKTGQLIFLDKMRVKRGREDSTVIATGFIQDSAKYFTISPKIAYKGNVEMQSKDEFLRWNGYVKPLHTLEDYPSSYFRYNEQPDPADVIIPAYEPMNEDRRRLSAAVSIANDSVHVYPTLFAFKRSYADLNLTTDTGIFYYDEGSQTFFVGDSMKLLGGASRGDFLSFNDATGEVYSEGKIDFGLNVDEKFNGIMAGNMHKLPSDSSFIIESILALNIALPEDCYKRMIEVIRTSASGNALADNDNELVRKAMAEYLDNKKLNKSLEMTPSTGEIKPEGDLNRNLFFTNTKLHYSPARQSFVSFEPVHIATINGEQINREINSRIVMNRKRSGTRYTLYLEVSKYDWFYIDYYLGSLNVASTD